MINSWRLAVGTLSALRWRPPTAVDREVAGRAMLLAPIAVLPLGVLVGLICWGGRELELAPFAIAFVAVGALALGSRALHLDGLSDVADGLTASYDSERSLEVMKGGTAGPAGAAALVLVLGIQAASLAAVLCTPRGPVVAGLLVCCSRAILSVTCARGVPGARVDGLAVTYVGTVERGAAVLTWVVVTVLCIGVLEWAGWPWWQGLVVTGVGLAVGAALTYRCVRRFGGVTGDVFGAAIEVTLAAMLLAAT
ncbi:adenosylcobinamide-GDP ribazoletransferase [Aeromicrobium panaciterrae]|uniref:Adenosylcobinamide-GDP ribazoletransferase n=1 Tax=Aeromicrobium panaciterrae TaxID=363861 RepID=A0ABU1US29_9ACTN|nr:adenosylcobinamide-GDP ribazoletransferase [Aeromicrobium panaciterrae]MDR7087984.1 adenosylcobinamide-GDP ribazoletransferase [Aeromicrobium panaciterrae]